MWHEEASSKKKTLMKITTIRGKKKYLKGINFLIIK